MTMRGVVITIRGVVMYLSSVDSLQNGEEL